MIDLSVQQLAVLGYVAKLDAAGVRATRDHLVRFMAHASGRPNPPASVTHTVNQLIKRDCLVRPKVGIYELTPTGRNAHFAAMEYLGVRNG